MDKKYKDDDFIDSLIKNNDFKNIKDTFVKMADYSSKEFSRFIKEAKKNREAELIPIKRKSLVEQKPKSIKSLEESISGSKFLIGFSTIMAAFRIKNIISFLLLGVTNDIAGSIVGLLIFMALGVMGYNNIKKAKFDIILTNRFKKYLLEFGNKEVAKISDLQRAAQVPREIVLMDIEELSKREYFKQASILDDKLIIDNRVYNEMKNMVQAEKNMPIENNYINELVMFERTMKEPMAGQIRELLGICQKVHTTIKEYPREEENLSKFREYYLPTVIKLLKEYENIEKNTTDEKSEVAKKDIEETLEQINKAFKNMLNVMYEDNMLDIKTDISVLKTLLISEGLLDEDLI